MSLNSWIHMYTRINTLVMTPIRTRSWKSAGERVTGTELWAAPRLRSVRPRLFPSLSVTSWGMIRPCEQLTAEGKESSSSVTDRDTWKQARGFGRRDISVTVMAKAYGTTPRKLFAIEFSVDPRKTGNIKSSRSNNCRSIVFALFSVLRVCLIQYLV